MGIDISAFRTKQKKMIKGKAFGNVRDCILYINKESISKDSIVSIFPFEGMIFLIWSKND